MVRDTRGHEGPEPEIFGDSRRDRRRIYLLPPPGPPGRHQVPNCRSCEEENCIMVVSCYSRLQPSLMPNESGDCFHHYFV